MIAGQVTPEALTCLATAERSFFLVAEPATRLWLETEFPRAQALHDAFWEGRPRQPAYEEIVERILAPVREGHTVCAAFYGHPGVFVYSSHAAIRKAREEGFEAQMLPGISAEDCLFADLEVDPAAAGCQSFEATDFLIRERPFDRHTALVLWQIGVLGVNTYHLRDLWNADGLHDLVEVLQRSYPADHPITVYEGTHYPVCDPLIQRASLRDLTRCKITTHSTLWIPPAGQAPLDAAMLARIRATREPA